MIWHLCSVSLSFGALLKYALTKHPCSLRKPWRIIFYFDEVSPQNPLASGKDKRNTQNIYWTFAEFEVLWRDEVWMFLACTRSATLRDTAGGMSAWFATCMLQFFQEDGHHFERNGLSIELKFHNGTAHERIFAKHFITIADFKALCEVVGNRFGTVPCPICRNVVDLPEPLPDGVVPMTCVDRTKWKQHDDASVRAMHESLVRQQRILNKTAFTEHQQVRGWTYNPMSIVLHSFLQYRAVSTLCFDSMHVWCVDGCFARELRLLMLTIAREAPRNRKVRYEDLDAWMRRWHWPGLTRSATKVFETGGFQASASETLSAAPVLKKYFRDIVLPMGIAALEGPIHSFLLACDVVEIIGAVNRGASPTQLKNATIAWQNAHVACYGDATWVFKHHQAGHLGPMWESFGIFPNCWTMERKHKESKRVCTDHFNTIAYEQSIMEEITLDCIHAWKTWRTCGLLNPRECAKKTVPSSNPGLRQQLGPSSCHMLTWARRGVSSANLTLQR
jgi:hypothetical protein